MQKQGQTRLSFDHLEGFVEISKVGSFSRAAANLYRTQPALSQQIQRLEKNVGEQLFERRSKNAHLTRAGVIFRRYAQKLLDLRSEALEDIALSKKGGSGSLRIGANEATCLYLLPASLSTFRRRYPSVRVNIYRNFSHKILQQIQEGNLDVGIISLPRAVKGLEIIPIFSAELKVLLPARHPLAGKAAVRPVEISYHPLLLPKSGQIRKTVEDVLYSYRKNLQIAMELASVEVMKKFVAAGIGISFLPEAFARAEIRDGTLQLVSVEGHHPLREVGMAYRRKSYQSLPTRAFLEIMQNSIGAEEGFTTGPLLARVAP